MSDPLTPALSRVLVALMGEHAAVAHFPLPDGAIAVTARNEAGEVVLAEVYTVDGKRHDTPDVVLAESRAQHVGQAEAAMQHLIAVVAHRQAGGEERNLAELARRSAAARSTLYLRLEAERVAADASRPARALAEVLA